MTRRREFTTRIQPARVRTIGLPNVLVIINDPARRAIGDYVNPQLFHTTARRSRDRLAGGCATAAQHFTVLRDSFSNGCG
jgi:hypothetical protein